MVAKLTFNGAANLTATISRFVDHQMYRLDQ